MAEAAHSSRETDDLMRQYCLTRDVNLRNQILGKYMYIAEIAAKKFAGRGVDYDDLLQVASLALIKALERYDCSRNVQFASFATPSVMGEIKNYFRDKSRLVRVPRRETELLVRMDRAIEELTLEYGRQPNPEEIAKKMNLPLETVKELLEMKSSTAPVSFDDVMTGFDGEKTIGDLLGAVSKEYGDIENADFLSRAWNGLTEEDRSVLIERYVYERSQRQIAQEKGMSQMYVSRLERKAIAKLRQNL